MSIREWVNERSAMATIVAILILIGALAYLFVGSFGGRGRGKIPDQQYFWDTKDQKLVARPRGEVPPVKLDSGGEAVKAMVYSCGSCDPESLTIAWLEKYPPKARTELIDYNKQSAGGPAAMSSMDPTIMRLEATKRVKTMDSDKWVPTGSPEGRKITGSLGNACSGGKIKFCYPGR